MITPGKSVRRNLQPAAVLLAALLAASAAPSAALANDGACAAAPPNGSPFGKRFGKLLGTAGIAALTGRKAAAQAAADAAVRDVVDSARETAIAEASAAACRKANGEEPHEDAEQVSSKSETRTKRGKASLARPGLMPVAADVTSRKRAFDEFGKVRCSSCEGGHSFDGWANQFFYSEVGSKPDAWTKKLAAMEEGETLNWQGSESYGTILFRGDDKVNGFDCKSYVWTLEKGSASAQRDGLLCWGKASDFSAGESWVEVY